MRLGVLTGGGDCPGLNPAIRGVVMRALDYHDEVIGFREGWAGIIKGDAIPLTLEDVEEIIGKGGTILGSSRTNPYKKDKETGKDRVAEVIATFKKFELDALIGIGGDDTLGVASKLYSQEGLPCVGVPKTMDNDLYCTDFTFGFDTSVTLAVDAVERLRDTAKSHRRAMVLEVMGRHAGWVALYTAIAGGADWVLLPEQNDRIEKELEDMLAHLQEIRKRGKRYAIVVVSEGVELPKKTETEEELDEFGHMLLKERGIADAVANYIKDNTGWDTRTAVIGHMQRGGPPTLFDRMLGTRVGAKAVDLVHEKKFGQMAALVGNEIVGVDLKEAVGKQKLVTEDWIKFAKIFFK
ncbi:MAG: 6-phosphofructokinase [bacterium]|nr:6-phosphofructokinase [bacterium]